MNPEELLLKLNEQPEMNPDSHDGSYELMREIIKSYSTVSDYSVIDFKDLNAVYAMAIGTWKMNVERKKEYVYRGHLSSAEKERMAQVIDRIWDHACNSRYENRENNKPTIGMFGTGFYSFERTADDSSAQRFIKMMVDISDMTDDNQMFDCAERVFNKDFKGMQAAAASVMLHCLKPLTFPILNTNFGDGTIFDALGIKLEKEGRLSTYIGNCRRIKAFRDEKVKVKNYRVFDRFPRIVVGSNAPRYIPSLDEYDPGIDSERYTDMLQHDINKDWLDTVYYIYLLGGEATCSYLSKNYGKTAQHYNANAINVARIVYQLTQCPLSPREEGGDRFWAILFQGRYTENNENGVFSWKLREPLFDAIAGMDAEGFFDDMIREETPKMDERISKNTILYGPPGTGKTYNTVIYAVAVIEHRSVEEVYKEAVSDYPSVKQRYDGYKKEDRIAFVTFHQSYGYEEFIEGIKPVMDNEDTDSEKLEYTIEPGIFKKFCERAGMPKKKGDKDYEVNSSPSVWKVSLERTGENPTRRECFENGHIRIGWDEYGAEISDNVEYPSGKAVLNSFINKMKIGDIVVSCYSSTQIDAIGIVTGDYEWADKYEYYNRVRNVKWLAKDIREDIVELNGGHALTLSTVYKLSISPRDVLELASKYTKADDPALDSSDDNFVFIIDEINRGNISKIFGELITLIEENKRRGAPEESTAKLPYSHESFGVPDNVYILGTMNTADRSIAIMDTALRRRFSFVEMLPDSDVIRSWGDPVVTQNGISVNVADMLDIINDRITFLYDREHTIGHAFFRKLKNNATIEVLAEIFEKSIIPLLQEYFYEDYEKIQLVLGDDGKNGDKWQYKFIADKELSANDVFSTTPELEPIKKYSINYDAFFKIESYKYISKKL